MSDVRDAVLALLGGHAVRTVRDGQDDGGHRAAFADLAQQGWTRVGLPEDLGGHGGTLADAADAVSAAAYLGVATPLADQVMVANAAAGRLGIAVPGEVVCLLPVIAEAGRATAVPWASWGTHLLVADRAGGVALIAASQTSRRPGANLAGLPSDAVRLPGPVPGSGGAAAADLLTALGALTRALQIVAALERCQDLSVTYARQRRQFGQALADLPVVQHELAALAGEAAAARAASRAAVDAVAVAAGPLPPDGPAALAIAVAKVRAGLAATAGARSAHQIHGAIGITREYELHVHTLSMWAWRDEYGAERTWAQRLGENVRSMPGGLWAALSPGAPT